MKQPKPKQPIIGISLEQREYDEVKDICGEEELGWVARQVLYRWVLAVREGKATVPSRTTQIKRLPERAPVRTPAAPHPSKPVKTAEPQRR